MKSTPRKSKTAPAKGTQSTKPKTKGSKAVATAPATSHPSTAKTPPNPASGTPSAKPSDAEVIQSLEEIKAMMGETSDQIPESPPPASGTARAGMTVNEFSDVVTNEADMRAGGWSEEEIKEIKAGKERAKAEAELEASALYKGDSGKPRRRELDYLVQDFLKARHAGFTLPRLVWSHKTNVAAKWTHPEARLILRVIQAVYDGDFGFFTTLAATVTDVKKRSDGAGKSFTIEPAKETHLALATSLKGGTKKSGEDLAQDVFHETKVPISSRRTRKIAAAHGIPPANKGGCGTHK